MPRPPCILVIDDELVVAERVRAACHEVLPDAQVVSAGSAADASRALSHSVPDLIILDLVLGNDTGYDVIPEVRAVAPHVPIVVMSSHDSESTRYICAQRGAKAFEPKPADAAGYPDLIRRIQPHLRASPVSLGRFHR
ncbi:MAG TPA: response regulator [Planctomycetota bacterium]|nr:response regulator [Planctomycetota bacterium]